MKFLQFCEKERVWPLFTTIVTDFSKALINAGMLHWNKCDLETYLNFCYHKLQENVNVINEMVVFKLCYAHFKKNVSRKVDTLKMSKNSKLETKRLFKYGFHANDFSQIKLWFRHLVVIHCSKTENTAFQASLKELNEMSKLSLLAEKNKAILRKRSKDRCNNSFMDNTERLCSEELNLNDKLPDCAFISQEKGKQKSFYKRSHFYRDFMEIYKSFEIQSQDTIVTNSLCCREFVEYVLQYYIPFLPMWSSVVSDGITNAFTPTNGMVEGWFHEVKHNIISKVDFGAGRLKYGRFIDAVRENILSETKQVLHRIPSTNLNRCNPKNCEQLDLDLNSLQHLETWGRREMLSPRMNNFSNLK